MLGPDWRCRSCGRINDPERRSFCGDCFAGRTQAIEDQLADKLGLPQRRIRRSARAILAEPTEWCLHCGSDTCVHATRHNAAYGR